MWCLMTSAHIVPPQTMASQYSSSMEIFYTRMHRTKKPDETVDPEDEKKIKKIIYGYVDDMEKGTETMNNP